MYVCMYVHIYIYTCWNNPFFVKAASANKWRVPLIFPKLGYTVLGYCTCHRCPFTKRQVEFSADLTRFGFVNEVSKIQCFSLFLHQNFNFGLYLIFRQPFDALGDPSGFKCCGGRGRGRSQKPCWLIN